jgi:hypothetical protein
MTPPPSNLDKDYLRIGKCRKGKKTRGGIGLCVSRKISVLDDNLHGSRVDELLENVSKLKTYIAFLDLSKAFDRVWREGLFYPLWKNVVQGKEWRLLKELYSTVSNKVVLGNLESEWFNQDNDVKQGCILSPSLFSVMMKDLTDMLSEHNIGVPIAS